MAMPRKDVRFDLDEMDHARLKWCAAKAGLTIAEYVESLIHADIASKVDRVVDDYHDLVRSGLVGKTSDMFGDPRKGGK
jgi:hypothetical protein